MSFIFNYRRSRTCLQRLTLAACFCILCVSNALASDRTTGSPAPPSVLVRLCIHSGENVVEYPYIVSVATRKSVAYEEIKTPYKQWEHEWRSIPADETKRRKAVYERIVERFLATKSSDRNPDLAGVLKITMEGGFLPEFHIVASPNGRYAIHTCDFSPHVLLVDTVTLATRRIGPPLVLFHDPTPVVAWSPDSRYAAVAPIEESKLIVFDVERMIVASTKTGVASRVQAIAWSPDGQRIAVLEYRNWRLEKNPLNMLGVFVGHATHLSDAVLSLHQALGEERFSVMLRRRIVNFAEAGQRISWVTVRQDSGNPSHHKSDGSTEDALHLQLHKKP